MTDVLVRPRTDAGRGADAYRPVVVAAATAAAGVVIGVLIAITVVVLVVWSTDGKSGSGAADALRTAGQVWLLAHGTVLGLSDGQFRLVPLGLTVLPAVLLVRAGASLARATHVDRLGAAAGATLALATSYAVIAAVVTGPAATSAVHPAARQALLGAGGLGLVAGGYGVLRESALTGRLLERVPHGVRRTAVASGAAGAVLVGLGGALALLSLAVHLGRVGPVVAKVAPGPVGVVALALVSVALLPNAVLSGTAYLLGPGFAVGAHTTVSPFGTRLGELPALPLLVGLPAPGGAGAAVAVVFLAPLTAGVVAGLLVLRDAPALVPRDAALRGLACGPCVGVALGALSALAGGSAGPGRLAVVGPSPWQVGLVAAVGVGVVGAATAWVRVRRPRLSFDLSRLRLRP